MPVLAASEHHVQCCSLCGLDVQQTSSKLSSTKALRHESCTSTTVPRDLSSSHAMNSWDQGGERPRRRRKGLGIPAEGGSRGIKCPLLPDLRLPFKSPFSFFSLPFACRQSTVSPPRPSSPRAPCPKPAPPKQPQILPLPAPRYHTHPPHPPHLAQSYSFSGRAASPEQNTWYSMCRQ